jgi:hypothetical protein
MGVCNKPLLVCHKGRACVTHVLYMGPVAPLLCMCWLEVCITRCAAHYIDSCCYHMLLCVPNITHHL